MESRDARFYFSSLQKRVLQYSPRTLRRKSRRNLACYAPKWKIIFRRFFFLSFSMGKFCKDDFHLIFAFERKKMRNLTQCQSVSSAAFLPQFSPRMKNYFPSVFCLDIKRSRAQGRGTDAFAVRTTINSNNNGFQDSGKRSIYFYFQNLCEPIK